VPRNGTIEELKEGKERLLEKLLERDNFVAE
jgi:hypothetical protein